uniref:Uncharacterized protein n=1 Tax=Avena sativa TaxID=4498 RepID=A0ACD5Y7A5_AVESA
MNCFGWNCRGAGNKPTVHDLVAMVAATKARLVFLCETRQKANKVRRLRNRLGLRGFCGVDSDGLSGGLALFWCDEMSKSISDRHIDAHIQISPNDPVWRLTCVYGEPRMEDRHRMWTLLQNLKSQSVLPWCVFGDFNETMWSFEHFSIRARPEPQMLAFRDVLEICELIDLGFSGVPYTYDNRRSGRCNVKVRLDRAVADNRWRNMFTEARVVHQVSPYSDHSPILLPCEWEDCMPTRTNQRRYEIMWEREASLSELISNLWAEAGTKRNLGDISKALDKTMKGLHSWSKNHFGKITCELNLCRSKLDELMHMNADHQEIRNVTDRMNELLYREEMMWLQ